MVNFGFSDLLSLGQTIGIIGTMVVTLYFSRKQIQGLSVDIETKVLNDLGEKVHKVSQLIIEHPFLIKVINNPQNPTLDLAFAYYVLYTCSHAYDMRERQVLNDNEWSGWLQWMRNCFKRGTIREIWKEIEPDKWFDPSFQNFINTEIVRESSQKNY
jgi:hypothetical protein